MKKFLIAVTSLILVVAVLTPCIGMALEGKDVIGTWVYTEMLSEDLVNKIELILLDGGEAEIHDSSFSGGESTSTVKWKIENDNVILYDDEGSASLTCCFGMLMDVEEYGFAGVFVRDSNLKSLVDYKWVCEVDSADVFKINFDADGTFKLEYQGTIIHGNWEYSGEPTKMQDGDVITLDVDGVKTSLTVEDGKLVYSNSDAGLNFEFEANLQD